MADQLAIQRKRKDPRHIMFRVERATLASGEDVNFHPLINTATLRVSRDDLLAFFRNTGHEPLIVDFEVVQPGA